MFSGFVERLRASARKKKKQFQVAVSGSARHKTRDLHASQYELRRDPGPKLILLTDYRSLGSLNDDQSMRSLAFFSSTASVAASQRSSLATEGELGSPEFHQLLREKFQRSNLSIDGASTITLTPDVTREIESGR